MDSSCIFCRIIDGTLPSHQVWEDEHHLAFLSIFPNTPGFTVVVTKQHLPSDALRLPTPILMGLMQAAQGVNERLVAAFADVGRCALVLEGFGVDHVHAKLIPLHGTRLETWQPINAEGTFFTPTYLGYIDTHDGPRADDNDLAVLARKISQALSSS